MTHKVFKKGGDKMPKVTLTESQRVNERLRHNLRLIQGHRNSTEMAKIIGKSQVTYLNRLANPESLSPREVRMLCRYFNISVTDFIGKELTISIRGGDKN